MNKSPGQRPDPNMGKRFSQDLDRVLGVDYIYVAVAASDGSTERKRVEIIQRITLCDVPGFAVHGVKLRRGTYFKVSDVETGFAADRYGYQNMARAISAAESNLRLASAMNGLTPEQFIAKSRAEARKQFESTGSS